MKPPLRTDLRISAEIVEGDIALKNHAVVCAGKPLRVEMLDALIVRSGSMSATALASVLDAGCSVIWEGKAGQAAFTPATRARSTDFLVRQAECASRKVDRLAAIRRMMSLRFDASPPRSYTENEIRGWEGRRMATLFRDLAREHGIDWNGRQNDPSGDFQATDPINRALSSAFAILYREVHLCTLVMGMSPALGFLHRGDLRSFVYDAADLYKNDVATEVFALFVEEDYVAREWISDLVRTHFIRDMKDVLWG